jgi:tetratricopeptide (TPR) repeat protein
MDWYRRKTWTKVDEKDFFAKLGRARKHNRAQYIRVQAIELIMTKNEKLLEVAEVLLNKLLVEYPDNRIEKSQTLSSLGDIYNIRQDYEKAIEYYRHSLDFEEIFPNVITQSYLDYSELIVKTEKADQYEFVEELIKKRITNSLFPIEKYKGYSILSIIYNYKGDILKAKYFENLANDNANFKTSGLRYHKYLGVVQERDTWLDKIVKRK